MLKSFTNLHTQACVSQECYTMFVISNLLYVHMPKYFTIMPTQITFQLKNIWSLLYKLFHLPTKTQQTQRTKAQKITSIVLGLLTN